MSLFMLRDAVEAEKKIFDVRTTLALFAFNWNECLDLAWLSPSRLYIFFVSSYHRHPTR